MKFSIIIPNWNGRKLLEKNLPAVLATGAEEVIVVDNGSTDGSKEYLKSQISKIKTTTQNLKLILNNQNLGFARAVNQGVKAAKGGIVVLLNNDVVPEKDFLKPLIKDFQDSKIFAISLGEVSWNWARGKWIKGFVEHESGPKTKTPHISFWASGGSGAFRKDVWLKLGGFDEIFAPFYWEDIDLSYRAWKRGYEVLWEPDSVVHHQHETTIGLKFSKDYIDLISQRNQLLFIWKNIVDLKMLYQHKIALGKKLLTQPKYWRPFLTAWARLLLIFPRWLREFNEKKIADKEIFALFN